ncbi:hypothetical protein Poli38472_007790 [Pythium oligandrum]|uniref:RRM domain-containing protein n=1 Tax=Pythium oligandrum TaxID=41045 RepID=A0A8K1CSG5_PYTOL|nr:hypothetical protein Poli38472_007790 [Pythium oligandrum]|eukprot:TMW68118.1 hypothetical protein Poli38472_007790 [Pythium oligandrum]
MDAHQRRLAEARERNLAYIRQLDEKHAEQAASAFLEQFTETDADKRSVKKKPTHGAVTPKNTSVYITGLTTYMACKQLEGVCAQLGKVRRIKFYKDERGGLKGDALVSFASHAMMRKAVERVNTRLLCCVVVVERTYMCLLAQLNHFEIKPGVLITATEADFGKKETEVSAATQESKESETTEATQERLFAVAHDEETAQDDAEATADSESKHEVPSRLDLPSRSVILKHVWDPLTPQDNATAFFSELEDDMRDECSKHGPVEHVHILPTGGVIIRYEQLDGAIKCLQVMHGRWFDGRQIVAQFDPSTPEEPEDPDTKLEAFFASLG